MGFLPSRIWTQQPQQALPVSGSDLMRGAYVWTPHNPFQLTGKKTLIAASEGAYGGSPVGEKGVSRKWLRSANAGLDFGTIQAITQNAGVTVLVVAAPTAATSMKVPFSQRIAGGSYTQTDFVFNAATIDSLGATSGQIALTTYHAGSGGVLAASQIDGRPHCWVAGNGPANGYIFRDGVKQTLAASTRMSTFTAGTQKLRIGNIADDATTTYPCDDPVYLVIVWDRLLSEIEARSVSENPWQAFSPLQKNIFSALSGGSNIALAINESWHAHASDGVLLGVTGSASLSVSEAVHAHAADAISLTSNWLLTISDALHGHTIDGVVLDASNAAWLTIGDSLHGHAADSLSLSTQSWLAILDAVHGHIADAPGLGPGQFALQIAEALHAVSSDAPYLSLPGGALVVNPRYIVKAIARDMKAKAAARNYTVKR